MDHTGAPDGPFVCAPDLLLPVAFAVSSIVYVFQMTLPFAASSATTLPRNVHHSYSGLRGNVESYDDTGTYNTPR